MSISALALATRDYLRDNLTNFYTGESGLIAQSCRVMPNHHPPAMCGDEFIAIYGSVYRPREVWIQTAIEEQFGLTIAITRRINLVPRDSRGEIGYIIDPDQYADGWKSIDARSREIVGLLDKNYALLRLAEALFDNENGFSEPLYWVGTDPAPTEVSNEHFCAYHAGINNDNSNNVSGLPGIPEADDVYGLLTHIRFDGAIRFQPNTEYDIADPSP
jgi:hypothetical protein